MLLFGIITFAPLMYIFNIYNLHISFIIKVLDYGEKWNFFKPIPAVSEIETLLEELDCTHQVSFQLQNARCSIEDIFIFSKTCALDSHFNIFSENNSLKEKLYNINDDDKIAIWKQPSEKNYTLIEYINTTVHNYIVYGKRQCFSKPIISQYEVEKYKGQDSAYEDETKDDTVAPWKLLLACLFTLGIGQIMLFLLRTSPKIVVWTVLTLVVLFLFTAVPAFWDRYIKANPQHSEVYLAILIFFTTVLPVLLSIIVYIAKKVNFISICYPLIVIMSIQADIHTIIVLLQESAKAIFSVSYLFIVSILAFLVKLVILIIFFATTMYMGSTGTLDELYERYRVSQGNSTTYFTAIFNACLTIWAIQSIASIQNMMLFRAIAKWYYSMARSYMDRSIFTIVDAFTLDSNVIALESFVMTAVATITSLLASLRRNALVRYLPIYEKLFNFLYDNLYYFSGIGFVILFNLRVATASVVWNTQLGIFISFMVVMRVLWSYYNHDKNIVMAIQNFWVLITFFSILLLIVVSVFVFLKKKLGFVVTLLKESLKATSYMYKFSVLFTIQLVILVLFATETMNMGASGVGILSSSIREYLMFHIRNGIMLFSIILNACVAIWTIKFVAGIEYMIITTAVAKWYFSRKRYSWNKDMQFKYSSSLFQINLGHIAFDSLLNFFGTNKDIPGFSFIKRCLMYLSYNGYILAGNNERSNNYRNPEERYEFQEMMDMAAFNYAAYFVLFIVQLLVVTLSLLSAYLIMLNTNSPHQWDVYVIVGAISIVIASTFFSIFQTVLDAVLLCFCEDWLITDVMAKPYSMSYSLNTFIECSWDTTKKIS